MTVENTQNKMPPLQMGTTNEYPFTFAVLLQDPTEEEAVKAIKASVLQADGTEIELVYNTDYTVTLNTDRIGGTLTVNDIRTSSDYITIYRQYEQTQEVDYKDFNSAPAETFEQCFDKLTMLSQQQQEEINRSIKLPVSSGITDLSLPNPIAGRTLKWNESETGLINSDVSIDEIDEFVQTAAEASANATEQAEIASEAAEEAVEKGNEINNIWNEIVEGNMFKYSLFDTILKDHVLTYEESKGLALQGTYVYKEAIAGSRYGYPDFYNKCLEEYQASDIIAIPNVDLYGTLASADGVLSGFSASNYAQTKGTFNPNSTPWEIVIPIRTGSNVATQQYPLTGDTNKSIAIGIQTDGRLTFNIGNGSAWIMSSDTGSFVVSANTSYLVKLEFTGSEYILSVSTDNGNSWTVSGTYSSTTAIGAVKINFGTSRDRTIPFLGSIDLNKAYININGQTWWKTGLVYKHSNGHLFYNIADKNAIDDIFNSTGMAWFYGIDQENERIFLPRNNWFDQLTGDASEVGKSVEAGLPNITGSANGTGEGGFSWQGFNVSGAFTKSGSGTLDTSGKGGSCPRVFGFDASKSNPIYGNSNTVQPNAVKKLLYICVGNTESVSSVTNVIDVTTTENDTIPLGFSTYQNGAQASVSWLKSEGQWNDGNIYTTFYNEFVQKIGQAFGGGSVVEYTSDYTDYDLVINQDNMTFRLPLLNGDECVPSDKYTNLTANASGTIYTAPANGWVYVRGAHTNSSDWGNFTISILNDNDTVIYSFEGTRSLGNQPEAYTLSISAGQKFKVTYSYHTISILRFIYAQGNGSLYFKVANAVQNLELLNAGEVMEAVQQIGAVPHVIESYVNGSSGYRLWSDNWCEQWGYFQALSEAQHKVCTFLKPFRDANYAITTTVYAPKKKDSYTYWMGTVIAYSATEMVVQLDTNAFYDGAWWRAEGYIA